MCSKLNEAAALIGPEDVPVPALRRRSNPKTAMVRVLFVCLGNICRSPLAEGIFRRLITEWGLTDRVEVDSAGTGGWHVGDPPDRRMQATAEACGVSLSGIKARRVERDDLEVFDYIFAMDRENLRDLRSVESGPPSRRVGLFRDFDPEGGVDVPDPYYGGARGFQEVFDIVDRTCRSILDHICREEGIASGSAELDAKTQDSDSA